MLPMLVLLFGFVQYGLYFYSAQAGSNAANAAIRQLAVGNCQSDAAFRTYVDGRLGAARDDSAHLGITRTYTNVDGSTPADPKPQNVEIGGTVELKITFSTINLHFPFVPFLSDGSLAREVQARVEDVNDEGCPG